MNSSVILILLLLGLIAGFLSGLAGIGGGIIIVPLLVYYLGFSQQQAQGTVLFMFLFPIGLLGVLNYYKSGYVDVKIAFIIAITFVLGSYLGSKVAISLDHGLVKKIFGILLLLISLKIITGK